MIEREITLGRSRHRCKNNINLTVPGFHAKEVEVQFISQRKQTVTSFEDKLVNAVAEMNLSLF
jgi:hypothetical protein